MRIKPCDQQQKSADARPFLLLPLLDYFGLT